MFRILAVSAFALALVAGVARADSWRLPTTQTYESPSGDARLTVVPRQLASRLDYFQDSIDGIGKPGQQEGSELTFARGRLERRRPDGKWDVVWDHALANDVAPVDVVVADGGAFVATFDNWHSMGFGKHVVVVYDRAGKRMRSHSLVDFVPRAFAAAMPRSVSSLDWRGDPRLSDDGRAVILPVVVPTLAAHGVDERGAELDDEADPEFVSLRIDGQTGEIAPEDAVVWTAAQRTAVDTLKAMLAIEAEYLRFRRDPLFAPADGGDHDWHAYLEEAYVRSEISDRYPRVVVLSRPNDADYGESLQRLTDALDDAGTKRDVVLGSPDERNLVAALARLLLDHRQGALAGSRIVVAVSSARKDAVASALRPSGAVFGWLDPATGIEQLPHRLPDEEDAAALAEAFDAEALEAATEAVPARD